MLFLRGFSASAEASYYQFIATALGLLWVYNPTSLPSKRSAAVSMSYSTIYNSLLQAASL